MIHRWSQVGCFLIHQRLIHHQFNSPLCRAELSATIQAVRKGRYQQKASYIIAIDSEKSSEMDSIHCIERSRRVGVGITSNTPRATTGNRVVLAHWPAHERAAEEVDAVQLREHPRDHVRRRPQRRRLASAGNHLLLLLLLPRRRHRLPLLGNPHLAGWI